MNEARIGLYLELIEKLLSCLSGEESGILQAHRELWDKDFVLVLRGVAALRQKDGQSGAGFLLSLAEQLAEALEIRSEESGGDRARNEQSYLAFLQEVLQAEAESGSDPKVVFPILARQRDKLNLQLIPVLQQVMERLITSDPSATDFLVGTLGNFCIDLTEFPLGNRANNLEVAIAGYEIVLSHRQPGSKKYAQTQNNLANAYCERINGSRAENLERAIKYFQAALTVRTCEDFPEQWAETQNNLANAYWNRIKGSRAENLERAIKYFQAALTVRTCEDFPEDWAMTQNNLANAYLCRINGSRAENLERAINHFQAALTVYKLEDFPENWAMIQNNLASAYLYRINGSRAENLERAINHFQAALTVYKLEDFPENWAMTQNNLANTYWSRIKGSRAENLEWAIESYQAALTVRTCENFPEKWAETQNNLANVYCERINGSRAENLERAIESYQAALTVRTCENFPEKWAETQNNLANAYWNRIKGSRAENLERAIESYQAALTVRTCEDFPEQWAMTQNNLANAYWNRIKGFRAENLERAIKYFQAALTVYKNEDFPEQWAMTQNNLASAYWNKINGSRAENRSLAIRLYKEALTVRTRRAFPINHVETLWNLGKLYKEEQQWQNAYDTFAAAIDTVELLRREESTDDNRQKLAEEWNRLYLGMVEVCIALELYAEAVEYAERSKGQNLIELLSVKDLYPKGEIPPEVRQELQSLKDRIYAEDQRLKQAPEKNYDLITQLRQQYAALYPYTPLKFPEIQELASASTALVEWYILTDRFCTFLVTGGIQLLQSTPQDQEQLVNWTREYLTDYYTARETWQNSLDTKLANLAQILHVDDILQTLPRNTQQLTLVPHRYLHLFPLHALPVRTETWQHFYPDNQNLPPHPHLLDCFEAGIHYAPSCQILHQVQKYPRGKFENFFGLQNPTDDLRAADIEVETIQKLFANAQTLVKTDAKKGNQSPETLELAEKVKNSHHLFFSCHGFFDPNDSLKSGLELADGTLTLEEIFRYFDLKDCSLVTLSACETGQVQLDNTDEYISLTSGFLLAGSPTLYVTLWSVNALSTAILLIKTYENLTQNPGKFALSLTQAQIWLRDTTIQGFLNWTNQCPYLSDEHKGILQRSFNRALGNSGADARIYENPYHWAGFCAAGKGEQTMGNINKVAIFQQLFQQADLFINLTEELTALQKNLTPSDDNNIQVIEAWIKELPEDQKNSILAEYEDYKLNSPKLGGGGQSSTKPGQANKTLPETIANLIAAPKPAKPKEESPPLHEKL